MFVVALADINERIPAGSVRERVIVTHTAGEIATVTARMSVSLQTTIPGQFPLLILTEEIALQNASLIAYD